MNPAILLQILTGLQLAIDAAPGVLSIVDSAKNVIAGLFSSGKITKEQQDALHARIEAYAAMVDANQIPDSWQVQPFAPPTA